MDVWQQVDYEQEKSWLNIWRLGRGLCLGLWLNSQVIDCCVNEVKKTSYGAVWKYHARTIVQ